MFNEIQNIYLDEFKSNLISKENDFFILKGPAGSGKTTLIKESVEFCISSEIAYEVLAFTGRASSILRNNGISNAKTINRWINQVKKNKYFLELSEIKYNSESFVIFIDEASMIPNSGLISDEDGTDFSFLLDELMWVAFKHLPFDNIFLVFVGDPSQLPPIYETFSPGLDSKFLNKRYKLEGKEFVLENIYRQKKDSEIIKFSKNFKMSKDNKDIPKPNYKNEEIIKLNEKNVPEVFLNFYNDDKNSVKIISPDNKSSEKYNFEIKKQMHDLRDKSNNYAHKYSKGSFIKDNFLLPQKGDILQISKNDYENELFNGQFVEIKDVGEINYIENPKNLLGLTKSILIDDIPFIQQKLGVELLNDTGDSRIKKNITISIDYLINNFYLTENEFNFFEDVQHGFISEIKDEIWNSDMEPKIKKLYSSNEILNPIYCKYGFSITGHKAQGGGWDNVIVDFSNFETSKGDLSPSWIYTSLTRTKSKTYFVNYPEYA